MFPTNSFDSIKSNSLSLSQPSKVPLNIPKSIVQSSSPVNLVFITLAITSLPSLESYFKPKAANISPNAVNPHPVLLPDLATSATLVHNSISVLLTA